MNYDFFQSCFSCKYPCRFFSKRNNSLTKVLCRNNSTETMVCVLRFVCAVKYIFAKIIPRGLYNESRIEIITQDSPNSNLRLLRY